MRDAAGAADHFVGSPNITRGGWRTPWEIPEHRVSFVRLGVDPEGFPKDPKTPPAVATDGAPQPVTIGFFSRIAPEKGLDRLARAVLQLAAQPEAPPSPGAGGRLDEPRRAGLSG